MGDRVRSAGEALEGRRHPVDPPRPDCGDHGIDVHCVVDLLPALGEDHRQHGRVDGITETHDVAPVDRSVGLAPERRMPGGELVDGALGIVDVHALVLVDHAHRAHVLHDLHELAGFEVDGSVVAGRHADRALVSEVLEEPDLADVHAQHRGGEHRLLGERRQLDDDGIEIATFEGRPVHGRRDTDALPDLLMTHTGDRLPQRSSHPARIDVGNRRRDRRFTHDWPLSRSRSQPAGSVTHDTGLSINRRTAARPRTAHSRRSRWISVLVSQRPSPSSWSCS